MALLCLALPAATSAATQTEQSRNQIPDEIALQDRNLEARIRAAFSNIDELSEVSVEVTGGVVKLTGETATWAARTQAEDLVKTLDGVLFVDNDIAASREVETRLAPAVEQVRQYLRDAVRFSPLLGLALAVFLLFVLLARLLRGADWLFSKMTSNVFIQVRLRQLVQTAAALVGILLALEILGVTAVVGAVLGTAGIAGIVLGFAFKEIVENYLAGLLLSLRHPFAPNDHIQVGEYEGKVVRLTSRETVLMTLDGNHVRLPNALVFGSVMINYTKNPRRRLTFTVGIGVNEDLSAVQRLGVSTLGGLEGVLQDPPAAARVEALGDSSVLVWFGAWVDQRQADYGKVKSEAIRTVKAAFDAAGVDMPEPAYQLKLRQMEEGETRVPAREPAAPISFEAPRPIDVSVDTTLDEQIEEDRKLSDEGDLLKSSPQSDEDAR